MVSMSATAVRKNIYATIAQVNESCEPVTITNNCGKSAVLIGEDDWNAIQETLYLQSIPGLAESILEGGNTPLDECLSEDDLEW